VLTSLAPMLLAPIEQRRCRPTFGCGLQLTLRGYGSTKDARSASSFPDRAEEWRRFPVSGGRCEPANACPDARSVPEQRQRCRDLRGVVKSIVVCQRPEEQQHTGP
jgi:hypothetical protein